MGGRRERCRGHCLTWGRIRPCPPRLRSIRALLRLCCTHLPPPGPACTRSSCGSRCCRRGAWGRAAAGAAWELQPHLAATCTPRAPGQNPWVYAAVGSGSEQWAGKQQRQAAAAGSGGGSQGALRAVWLQQGCKTYPHPCQCSSWQAQHSPGTPAPDMLGLSSRRLLSGAPVINQFIGQCVARLPESSWPQYMRSDQAQTQGARSILS